MSKRITTFMIVAAAVVAVLAPAARVASASSGVAKGHAFNVVMADPGCHWFSVAGKNTTNLTVAKFATLRNLDEATLVVKGAGTVQRIPVGKTLTVSKAGVYHVTMVKQASDDNHLLLVVK